MTRPLDSPAVEKALVIENVPPSDPPVAAAKPVATKRQRNTEKIQLATLCWTLFLAGWNDGSLGPLLPRIQQSYHIGYTLVSVLFVLQCAHHQGSFLGAMVNIPMTPKYGFGKLVLLGSMCQMIAYSLQASAAPFPVFVLAGFINGIGLAIQDAQANGYVASIASNRETGIKMGVVQAAYGAGALVAPLVSTQFAQPRFQPRNRWAFHYLVSLGMTVLNTLLLAAVFRGRKQNDCLALIGQVASENEEEEVKAANSEVVVVSSTEHAQERSHLRQIISLKSVHLLALYLLVYVGTEVTIGGWIVSFMITVRHGGPSSGYVSAGFFGGLTLGRVLLLPVNKLIGEYRAVYLYGILAIALELVIWLVPSVIGGAIAVSFVGLVLGPLYPIAMNHAGRVFPPRLLTGIIGFVAGVATVGAGVLPLVTGAIAGAGGQGIVSLEPVVVAMLVVMLGLWALVPRRRIDGQ
ncbi:major facilitator superfamily domain-containing protein [Mycena amicta]|nr:major facilitator superfamily domain-containing protein [Mycena amicta]